MSGDVHVRAVDDRGISLTKSPDRPVDVTFDGHRVWSFWVGRDTEPDGLRRRVAVWPHPLTRYLDGRTRVVVSDPASGAVHFDDEVTFGGGQGRVEVVNKQGHLLGIDKSGRLVPTFESRDRADITGLVEAVRELLAVLEEAGVRPFVGYGTLLGAVREGDRARARLRC